MIQTIFLLIHVYHNDTICSTECYNPQYQKPSEGQQKYHMQYHIINKIFILPCLRSKMFIQDPIFIKVIHEWIQLSSFQKCWNL